MTMQDLVLNMIQIGVWSGQRVGVIVSTIAREQLYKLLTNLLNAFTQISFFCAQEILSKGRPVTTTPGHNVTYIFSSNQILIKIWGNILNLDYSF